MGPYPSSGVRLRQFEMEEKFKSFGEDWGFDAAALQRAEKMNLKNSCR
jgi:hypothetical protein